MTALINALRRRAAGDRRGIALIMVMMVVSSLLIIGILFAGSVTAEYRAAVYYRQAIQSEQYCIVGLHRAMAELSYDVWGVYEDKPFLSARYNPADPATVGPTESLLPLTDTAYYDTESGSFEKLDRQRGYWNGHAWVVWAGDKVSATGDAQTDLTWNIDARPFTRAEKKGGALVYQSYGNTQGTVTCTNGSTAVTGVDTEFVTTWAAGTAIAINGKDYTIASVTSTTSLTLNENFAEASAANLPWHVSGSANCPSTADDPPSLPGGSQPISDFLATGKGYMANPKWVDPAQFIIRRPASLGQSQAWTHGGVDINGDGSVTEADKNLRDWALWQFRRDAFLPEAMDNTDLFQNALHANNRRLWSNGTTYDYGWEFISPKIVGDSFYLVFRSDPLYSLAGNVSEDPSLSVGDPLDGSSDPGVVFDGRSDQAGYRYPYDRTHLNKWNTVPWDSDGTGGLANINGCNNDYNIEQWTSVPGSGSTIASLTWYHYPESKWIYCYDPIVHTKTYGRYAVTIQPDCGTWNASGLQSGNANADKPGHSFPILYPVGNVASAGGYLSAIRVGFDPKTGDGKSATMMPSALCKYSPVRPDPLPTYWASNTTDGRDIDGDGNTDPITYWPGEGNPDNTQMSGKRPVVDYSRAPEIWGGHGGHAWDSGHGVRSAIFNYLIWLGPYESRAEFATHLRKACIAIPNPSPDSHGGLPSQRACMETDINNTDGALQRVSECAMLISSLSTVQGYYYTLDRFWDRDLLLLNNGTGTSGSDTDSRFTTAQCERTAPIDTATAAAKPGQRTRQFYIDMMDNLECFGGYRTRDGNYKLLDYLFHTDQAGHVGYAVHTAYGGAGNPQKFTSRRQKFMAMTVSRLACQQRETTDAVTAACHNGHLVHNPKLGSFHKPVFNAGAVTYELRTETVVDGVAIESTDATVDEMGQGCPVCGGKLFQAAIYEVNINEIGRFYEDFKNAERPVRPAFNVENPAEKPTRHFIELFLYRNRANNTYCGTGGHDWYGRFDRLSGWNTTGNCYAAYPGILGDPHSLMPYFTHVYDFDLRWRQKSSEPTAIDPEPLFTWNTSKGWSGWREYQLLVYDDDTGRWTNPVHCADYGYTYDRSRNLDHVDVRLHDGKVKYFRNDSDPDSDEWAAADMRYDAKYVMLDPDPAHHEAASTRGFEAAVSIYRKMPVRWYGGDRMDPWRAFFTAQPYAYFKNDWVAGKAVPSLRSSHRGISFINAMATRHYYEGYQDVAGDWGYIGDYDAVTNPGGWPGPTERAGVSRKRSGFDMGERGRDPRQYAVVTFDSRFDGSKLALVRVLSASNYSDYTARPSSTGYLDYKGYKIYDYVELTDSAGLPIKISALNAAGGPGVDPSDADKILSWQCRHPQDNRSNADGYMCWDLLPMTLQNTDHTDAKSSANGYKVWPGWWGNNTESVEYKTPDGKFTVAAGASFHEGWTRASAQGYPPGQVDCRDKVCNLRNLNWYVRDYPVRRSVYDGTSWTSTESIDARCEAIVYSGHDGCLVDGARTPSRKECSLSVPTGIGRQCALADANNPGGTPADHASWLANYSGRQHAFGATSGLTWTEGNNTGDMRYKWGAYSWNSWHDLYYVTDLCQQYLMKLGASNEDRDIFDGDQDGERDENSSSTMAYEWEGGSVAAISGRFMGEGKQINKLNLNELWYPPSFGGVGYKDMWYQATSSYTSFGRKPLKGFHAPSDAMTYYFGGNTSYNYRIKPWDLFDDNSTDYYGKLSSSTTVNHNCDTVRHSGRFDPSYASNSPVYTIFVTGNAVDDSGEALAEMRARVTIERTWDGRMNILEFTWLPTDRAFSE